jgi:hypothetical protein
MAEKDFRSRFGAKDLEGEEGGGCGRGCPEDSRGIPCGNLCSKVATCSRILW